MFCFNAWRPCRVYLIAFSCQSIWTRTPVRISIFACKIVAGVSKLKAGSGEDDPISQR